MEHGLRRLTAWSGLEQLGSFVLNFTAILLVYPIALNLASIASGAAFDCWKWIGFPLLHLSVSGTKSQSWNRRAWMPLMVWVVAIVAWYPRIETAPPFQQWILLCGMVVSVLPATGVRWLFAGLGLGLLAADLWHCALASRPLQYLVLAATTGLCGLFVLSARAMPSIEASRPSV